MSDSPSLLDLFTIDIDACPSMDILDAAESRSGDLVTLSLNLAGPPSATAATLCSNTVTTGGLWGAEWSSASMPDPTTGGGPNDNFYIAYRDNAAAGGPGVEAGRMNSLSLTLASEEFHPTETGTLGGTCASAASATPCTITMAANLSGLGIKNGAECTQYPG